MRYICKGTLTRVGSSPPHEIKSDKTPLQNDFLQCPQACSANDQAQETIFRDLRIRKFKILLFAEQANVQLIMKEPVEVDQP